MIAWLRLTSPPRLAEASQEATTPPASNEAPHQPNLQSHDVKVEQRSDLVSIKKEKAESEHTFQNTSLLSFGSAPHEEPSPTSNTPATGTTASSTNYNSPINDIISIQPIRMEMDGCHICTIISGMTPLMTGAILNLMEKCLGCKSMELDSEEVKVYGDHCEGAKKVLMTLLGVPEELIEIHKVKAY